MFGLAPECHWQGALGADCFLSWGAAAIRGEMAEIPEATWRRTPGLLYLPELGIRDVNNATM